MPRTVPKPVIGAAATAALAWTGAAAQTADVPFNGVVTPSCTVLASTPGTLVVNGAGDLLSSAAGIAGTALVTATGPGYEAGVDPPFGFDLAPSGGGADVAFSVSYAASGATVSASLNAGTPVTLTLGATTLTIDAAAQKTSGIFPAGAYRLLTTVRCVQP